jgi:aspartate/methionine/tyrosine aminotransferase
MNRPSARSLGVTHFLAMEVLERALELEAQGRDIVQLAIGEPDFPTPAPIVRAGTAALERGRTRYTHSLGIAPLRDAIAARFSKDYDVDLDPERVVVTVGSSSALLLVFAALLDPGDELVVTDPGYPCYPNIARAVGAVPKLVPVRPESGFAYDPDDVRRAVTPATKAIVVNSPSNPTGTLTPPDTMRALCEIGPAVVSDEIYHGLVYEGSAPSILQMDDDAFVVGGFSKRFAMTGWRLGYGIVPKPFLRHVQALQQNLFISASDFAQWAAIDALDTIDEAEQMRIEFDARRRYLLGELDRIGLPVPARPQGAFYVFADAGRYERDSLALAMDILERANVAVTPGIDFGPHGEGYLRISYTMSIERMAEGIRRLEQYFGSR